MPYSNPLMTARNQRVFLVQETTPGTPAYPTAATLTTSPPTASYLEMQSMIDANQQANYSDVETIRNSRTKVGRILDYVQYGSFSNFNTSIRFSGVAGVAPSEDLLLKAVFGARADRVSTQKVISSIDDTGRDDTLVTTSTAHSFKVGDKVIVSQTSGYNGNYSVKSVPSTTQVVLTEDNAVGASESVGCIQLGMTRYNLAAELNYYTIWILTETSDGSTLDCLAGCQFANISVDLQKQGEVMISTSGTFARKYTSTSTVITSLADNSTTVTPTTTYTDSSGTVYSIVANENFFVGQRVMAYNSSNTALWTAPLSVSAVTATTITISANPSTVGQSGSSSNAILKPYLPAATFQQVLEDVFLGAGLNDATQGGTYTGTAPALFEVIVDATGTPDTFKWRKNGGAFTTGVAMTGSAQTLSDGVTITFAATTGHTLADKWSILTTGEGAVSAKRNTTVYMGDKNEIFGSETGRSYETANKLRSKSFSMSVAQTIDTPLQQELNGSNFPSAEFIVADRSVTGEVSIAFRATDQLRFNQFINTPDRSMTVLVGDTAGSLLDIYMPHVKMDLEGTSVDAGAYSKSYPYTAQQPDLTGFGSREHEVQLSVR